MKKKIQKKFIQLKFKWAKTSREDKEVTNLEDAQSIGILFQPRTDLIEQSKLLIKELDALGKKADIYSIDSKEVENNASFNYTLINFDDFSLFGSPISENIKTFFLKKYEMLFLMIEEYNDLTKYLIKKIQAKCIIGTLSNDNTLPIDIVVYQDNENISNLAKNMLHYAKVLKKG